MENFIFCVIKRSNKVFLPVNDCCNTLHLRRLKEPWLGFWITKFTDEMLCVIWHHMCNLKNKKIPMEERYLKVVGFRLQR